MTRFFLPGWPLSSISIHVSSFESFLQYCESLVARPRTCGRAIKGDVNLAEVRSLEGEAHLRRETETEGDGA